MLVCKKCSEVVKDGDVLYVGNYLFDICSKCKIDELEMKINNLISVNKEYNCALGKIGQEVRIPYGAKTISGILNLIIGKIIFYKTNRLKKSLT